MTTTIIFQYPKPNHLCVRITRQNKDQNGTWRSVPMPAILGPNPEQSMTMVDYVHSGQRLIVDEVARSDTDLPGPAVLDPHTVRVLAEAVTKFAPDLGASLAIRWKEAREKSDQALEQFLGVLRAIPELPAVD